MTNPSPPPEGNPLEREGLSIFALDNVRIKIAAFMKVIPPETPLLAAGRRRKLYRGTGLAARPSVVLQLLFPANYAILLLATLFVA